MESMHERITVAVLNDYPVITHGVAQMLAADDRLLVVELDSQVPLGRPVDLALFDTFAAVARDEGLAALQGDQRLRRLVVYSWDVDEETVRRTLRPWIAGYLSKGLTPQQLCDALVRIHNGERVVIPQLSDDTDGQAKDWPGREAGLSLRESEVLSLITQGVTNQEIAEACYLSINSVKSYIRSAYRKINVERRSQAVLWGTQNGMLPVAERFIPGNARQNGTKPPRA